MAMFTPAQKPRGFARMIFTRSPFLPSSYRGRTTSASAPGKRHRHPDGVAMHANRLGQAIELLDLDLADLDDVLVAFLGDGPGDAAFRGGLANLGVVGLARDVIEV